MQYGSKIQSECLKCNYIHQGVLLGWELNLGFIQYPPFIIKQYFFTVNHLIPRLKAVLSTTYIKIAGEKKINKKGTAQKFLHKTTSVEM